MQNRYINLAQAPSTQMAHRQMAVTTAMIPNIVNFVDPTPGAAPKAPTTDEKKCQPIKFIKENFAKYAPIIIAGVLVFAHQQSKPAPVAAPTPVKVAPKKKW